MYQLKLTYFDIEGRGEPARLAMALGNIPFEDERIAMASWPAHKAKMTFEAVPVLTVNGRQVSQSNAINRFVGKLANLYPEDALQALYCDEVMDAVDDVMEKFVATFFMEEAQKKATREELLKGPIKLYLTRLQERLALGGGEFFAGNALSMADLKVYAWVKSLRSGMLDYVPTDTVDRLTPALVSHFEKIDAKVNNAVCA